MKLGKVFRSKKVYQYGFALAFLMLELFLMLGPQGWLRGEVFNGLSGENSWGMELSGEDGQAVCQIFRPRHRNLNTIGIVVTSQSEVSDGHAHIDVSDMEGNILFESEVPYTELEFGRYLDIPVDLTLSNKEDYYLTVQLEQSAEGIQPGVGVCGTEMRLYENRRLMRGDSDHDEIKGTQLLTRFYYSDAVSGSKVMKALFLAVATALLAVVRLPDIRGLKETGGILLLVLIPYILGRRFELLTVYADGLLPHAMRWNMAIMYTMELVFLLCMQSFSAAVIASDVVLTILYSLNYYVYAFRGVALKFSDLKAARTAAQVVSGYDLTPNIHLAMAWGIAVLIAVAGWKLRRKVIKPRQITKKIIIGRAGMMAGGIFLAACAVYMLICTDLLEQRGFDNSHGWRQENKYFYDGYLVASCLDIKNMCDILGSAPSGYSKQYAEEILEEYEHRQSGAVSENELPHVILIMNESFSDLRILGNLEISEENLGNFYGLQENTVRGNVNASVLGGGTCNSEFEVLTGCSMGFFPQSYYPYEECLTRPTDSLVSLFKEYGYHTYSMHPETCWNWYRTYAYEYLGFDESLWIEDFEGAETLHHGVSDIETYRKILDLYEKREKNEKLFVFDVTIQNHGGYTYEDNCAYDIKSVNVPSEEADNYLSLIKESDEAFAQLISYFAKEDEKVIMCMFGDHQPRLSDSSFYNTLYGLTEGLTDTDMIFNQYKTPFIIWANYDIEEMEGLDISMNYLGALLLDTIGIEKTARFNYVFELMEEYPIITVNGYQDKRGNIFEWSGTNEEFLDYRILQYDFLFD